MTAAIFNEGGSRLPRVRLADSDDDDSVNRARAETGCTTSVPGWRISYSERHIRHHGRSSSTFLCLSRKLSSLFLLLLLSPLFFLSPSRSSVLNFCQTLCVFLFLHRPRIYSSLFLFLLTCSMFLGFFLFLLTYRTFYFSLTFYFSSSLFLDLFFDHFFHLFFFSFSSLASPNRTFSLSSSSIACYFLVLLSKSELLIIF